MAKHRQVWLQEAERSFLVQLIEESQSLRDAARRAGVSPAALYRLLRRHRIQLKTVALQEE